MFAEAASLIITLKTTRPFPAACTKLPGRSTGLLVLQTKKSWDSAAAHLREAPGQCRQQTGTGPLGIPDCTTLWSRPASSGNLKPLPPRDLPYHRSDPDIYARLFAIRVNKAAAKTILKKIASPVKMARRDKYQTTATSSMAAQMELERQNVDGPMVLLEKTQYTSNDPTPATVLFCSSRQPAFGKTVPAKPTNYYDSIHLDATGIEHPERNYTPQDHPGIRSPPAWKIERQDSLQRIAALSENERKISSANWPASSCKQQGPER